MTGHEAEHAVIFGLDPLWLSTGILVVTYAVLLTEKVHSTVVALLGAGLVVISGILNQDQAIAGIDFNTIALLQVTLAVPPPKQSSSPSVQVGPSASTSPSTSPSPSPPPSPWGSPP